MSVTEIKQKQAEVRKILESYKLSETTISSCLRDEDAVFKILKEPNLDCFKNDDGTFSESGLIMWACEI